MQTDKFVQNEGISFHCILLDTLSSDFQVILITLLKICVFKRNI